MMASGPEKIKGRYPPLRPKAGSLASTNLRLQPLSDQGRGLAIDDAVQLFRRHQLAIPNGCPLVTIVQNMQSNPPGSRPTRTSRSKTLEMKAGRHSQTNWRAQERPHSEPRFHLMCFDASIRAIM